MRTNRQTARARLIALQQVPYERRGIGAKSIRGITPMRSRPRA